MVINRYLTVVAILVFALAAASAQQKPATAADKAAAEKTEADAAQKAALKSMAEMAAQQAEAVARAQQKVAEESRRKAIEAAREEEEKHNAVVPVDLEVVISRYQGDKKTSSLPYALTVNAKYRPNINEAPVTSLRMGGEVPLPSMAPAVGPDGKPLLGFTGGGPVQYKFVGTAIDAGGRVLDGGRFELSVSIEDDAIATPQGGNATALPVIRSFRASNTLVLRDMQTRQFIAAADRISGEVVRVDVTLKVVK